MDALKAIERRVEDGFVFDEHGRWIYMSELRVYEKRVIDELGKGNVLFGGLWVPIGEAKRRAKSMPVRSIPQKLPVPERSRPQTSAPADTLSFEAQDNLLETICMDAAEITQAAPGGGVNTKNINVNTGKVNTNNASNDVEAAVDFQGKEELHETAVFTMERSDTPAPVSANPPKSSTSKNTASVANANNADANVNTDIRVDSGINAKTNKKNVSAEVDGVLLFGLSKGAAAEQSKYAMEYIEEFRFARKRKSLFNALAVASVSLAAAAAVAFIVIQNLD